MRDTNKALIKLDSMPRKKKKKTVKRNQLFTQATKCASKMPAQTCRQNWAFRSILVNFHRSCRPSREKWPTVLLAPGPPLSPCEPHEPGPHLGWACCPLLCLEPAEFKSSGTQGCLLPSKALPEVPIRSRLLVPRFH